MSSESVAAYFTPAPAAAAAAVEDPNAPVWTRDMDDMLRMVLRQRRFDFAQTSVQLQRYILQARGAPRSPQSEHMSPRPCFKPPRRAS